MATQRQKKLARAIVKNAELDKPLNAGELLEYSGYSKSSSEASPGVIIDQKGVQEELRLLGFTETNAKSVVQEIMLDQGADRPSRLKAADMVFKVHGSYAPEKKDLTTGGDKFASSEETIALASKFDEFFKNNQDEAK